MFLIDRCISCSHLKEHPDNEPETNTDKRRYICCSLERDQMQNESRLIINPKGFGCINWRSGK